MEGADVILSVAVGIVVRFGVPISLTALAIFLLRKLDTQWQQDAESKGLVQVRAKNSGCWNAKNCPEEKRSKCKAFSNQDIPCWHQFRDNDGRLLEKCLGCDVFVQAPVPAT